MIKKTYTYSALFLAFLVGFGHTLNADEFRTFTSPDGRTVSAQPIGIKDELIRFKFKDGREMNLALNQFIRDDQTWLRHWRLDTLRARRTLLKVDVDSSKGKSKDVKDIGWAQYKKIPLQFKVKVQNVSPIPLESLRYEMDVSHKILNFQTSRREDTRIDKKKYSGSLSSIAPTKVNGFETEPIEINRRDLIGDYGLSNPDNKRRQEDELKVTEVRIYEDNFLIYQGRGDDSVDR